VRADGSNCSIDERLSMGEALRHAIELTTARLEALQMQACGTNGRCVDFGNSLTEMTIAFKNTNAQSAAFMNDGAAEAAMFSAFNRCSDGMNAQEIIDRFHT
jgi:hypothetical protein